MLVLNDYEIPVTIFPDKTSQVWKIPEQYFMTNNYIAWKFESESELFHLAQLLDLLRSRPETELNKLYVYQLPYARQDKKISNESTFALYTFMKFLNNLDIDEVYSFDVHSPIAHGIVGFHNLSPENKIVGTLKECKSDLVCFPDGGALKRYFKMIPEGIKCIYLDKVRNQLTGDIEGLTYTSSTHKHYVKGKDILLVDDLCDGGRTFIESAKLLLKGGAKSVDLYISHGIFSGGTEKVFKSGISRIFTKEKEVINHRINERLEMATKLLGC